MGPRASLGAWAGNGAWVTPPDIPALTLCRVPAASWTRRGDIWGHLGAGKDRKFRRWVQAAGLVWDLKHSRSPPCREHPGYPKKKRIWEILVKGTGIPLGHASSERVGNPGTLLWGYPEGFGGKIDVFKPLEFPSSSQKSQQECQEQTSSAPKPRGRAEVGPEYPQHKPGIASQINPQLRPGAAQPHGNCEVFGFFFSLGCGIQGATNAL